MSTSMNSTTAMDPTKNRIDFVVLFDVTDGNPNGDPDNTNAPRQDPDTGHGLVTDTCLKRKIRNYITMAYGGEPGSDIYIAERAVLAEVKAKVYSDLGLSVVAGEEDGNIAATGDDAEEGEAPPAPKGKAKGKGADKGKKSHTDADRVTVVRDEMCKRYWDVRTFGAVMSTSVNAGQVRGPVQLTFARSIDPITVQEHCITRCAVETTKESDDQGGRNMTMGRKHTVPYALYRAHGFVNAHYATKTGFSSDDLAVFWRAVRDMFEGDRAAARGMMGVRAIYAFVHDSPLGNASAHRLFDGVKVEKKAGVDFARSYGDYVVTMVDAPDGVTVVDVTT